MTNENTKDVPGVEEQKRMTEELNQRMRDRAHKGGTKDKTVQSKGIQDYETPDELINAVCDCFGRVVIDLAANSVNFKATPYLTKEEDSLSVDWFDLFKGFPSTLWGVSYCWLNPPFKTVRPWMEKCRDEAAKGCRILSLTKASIGSRWYREVVAPNAASYILGSRVTFVGETQSFTQDLMITEWGTGKKGLGYWDWKK